MTKISQDTISLKNKKIVFFGNERLVSGLPKTNAPILRGLIDNGYTVVAVVSHHSDSQSRTNRELEVAEIAKMHNIPLFLPRRPSDIIDQLRALHADIGVLVAYGRIINQEVIDLFPQGIVNIHPSLLPKYRGPTPIETAILNGDTKTGISIMQLTAGMDEGPVYAQQPLAIASDETKLGLYERIADSSARLFFETFPSILDGSLQPVAQISTAATYSQLLNKKDGVIDWEHKTADQIEHEVRAYENWPQSRTTLGDVEVIIRKAQVISDTPNTPGYIDTTDTTHPLKIAAKEGWLSISELKPLGKKEMPVKAFLAGYKNRIAGN